MEGIHRGDIVTAIWDSPNEGEQLIEYALVLGTPGGPGDVYTIKDMCGVVHAINAGHLFFCGFVKMEGR